MDLHRRRSVLVRMTEDGRRLGTARISNSAPELRREIAKAGKSPRVVLEGTYGWYWAADTLAAAQMRRQTPIAAAFAPARSSKRRIHVYTQEIHKAATDCGPKQPFS
jgi:hypothetical protein